MENSSTPTLRKIEFIAVNYSKLQGLRCFPIGMWAVFVCLWANLALYSRGILLYVLLLSAGVSAILYWLIDRYYKQTYGRVVQSAGDRRLDWALGIGGGLAGLAGFWLDAYHHLPFSAIGLLIALGILLDYLRLMRFVRIRYGAYTPIFALLLAVISILPLLGVDGWWHSLGMKTAISGALLAGSGVMVLNGITAHFYFTHTLSHGAPASPRSEA